MALSIGLPTIRNGWHLLVLSGELDYQSTAVLRQAVDSLVRTEPDPPILLDLTGLTGLDAAGLGALVAVSRRTSRVCLVGLHGPARRTYQAVGLRRVVPLFDDMSSAPGSCP